MEDEEKQQIQQELEQYKNISTMMMSSQVPLEWNNQRRKLGVTWRVLIGRGITSYNALRELKDQNEFFLQTLEKRNSKIGEMNRRLYELEDLLKNAGAKAI